MKVIYKYPVDLLNSCIRLPANGHILKINTQNGQPMCWAMVDPESEDFIDVKLKILGTGHRFDPSKVGDYVTTFYHGPFVWHVFLAPE